MCVSPPARDSMSSWSVSSRRVVGGRTDYRVAMEATGVYWKLVYNVLERVSSLTLWVVNAQLNTSNTSPGAKRMCKMRSGWPIS